MLLPSILTIRARRLYNKRSFLYEVTVRHDHLLVASRIKQSADVGVYFGKQDFVGSVNRVWTCWLIDATQATINTDPVLAAAYPA